MTFIDEEFGEVVVRKSALSRRFSFSVAPSGGLRISAPCGVSERSILRALNAARREINTKLGITSESEMKKRQRADKIELLQSKARRILPERLQELARLGDFKYEKVRFSHSSSRWGSCSGKGTISLNIALMQLPPVLIDYVLIHELAHTRQMNHSAVFWKEVERCDKNYKRHRKMLKLHSPHV
ncbi:MAG: M48 family metallopeptidase [Candidatus Nomurabacteria bacterium]|jgi:predicted metal-dependent hydrolase|nr:M48 family metallopeptidase [Candidatus Nomurabacteria bacterium]